MDLTYAHVPLLPRVAENETYEDESSSSSSPPSPSEKKATVSQAQLIFFKSMIGAGVLAFPNAFNAVGIRLGMIIFAPVTMMISYSYYVLAEARRLCHEIIANELIGNAYPTDLLSCRSSSTATSTADKVSHDSHPANKLGSENANLLDIPLDLPALSGVPDPRSVRRIDPPGPVAFLPHASLRPPRRDLLHPLALVHARGAQHRAKCTHVKNTRRSET